MNDKQLPILYTPVQTARILGISRSQVYNLMNSGELNSIHIGRSRRIAQTHVHDFINSLEVAVWTMNKDGKRTDNSQEEIIIIVEDLNSASTNRNLSNLQFGNQYTTTDIVIWLQEYIWLDKHIALVVNDSQSGQ